ncbi:MAG: hypothetical protein P9M00_12340 [Candidatus Tritonobacter lacicola]|nr:hypothetical protein [Candidatus Tritonobacter lacicola]
MSIKAIAILAVLIVAVGCGEKEDYKARFLELREQHKKEIDRLKTQQKEEHKAYEQKLGSYETELGALREKLDVVEEHLDKTKKAAGASPDVLTAGQEKAEEETVRVDEESWPPADIESSAVSPPGENDYMLEWFARSYEPFIAGEMREEYRKDFGDYIAGLREQSAAELSLDRKEKMLSGLQEQIAQTTDDGERELLEGRMEKIQNADEEDLEGVIDYYQTLDNIDGLNNLMEKYNISREELREAGVTPPPRDNWWPEAKEIAYNLNKFVSKYEPLMDEGRREQYSKDFSDYITDLTAHRTDEQVLQKRDQMIMEMEEDYKAASDREKQRLERRMRRLQNSDTDSLRRWIQIDGLRELNQMVEKYDIPGSELRQSGVWIPRRRGSRR